MTKFLVFPILVQTFLQFVSAQKDEIRIGAIFSSNSTRDSSQKSPEEVAFFLAIEWMNQKYMFPTGKRLRGFVEEVDPNDDYDSIYQVNKLLSLGIVALIGPLTSVSLPVIGPLTSIAHVPQILPLTSWDTSDIDVDGSGYEFLLRMSPTEKLKAQVMIEIVKHYKWKKVAVLGLRGEEYREYVQGKNAFRILASENEIDVSFDRLLPPNPKESHKIMPKKEITALAKSDLRVAIVFCPPWTVKELLKAAEKKKLIGEWAWIFSDLGSNNLELIGSSVDVPSYMRGLIGLRASMGKGPAFKRLQDNFNKKMESLNETTNLTAAASHVYDAVLITAKGIHDTLQQGIQLSSSQPPEGMCHKGNGVAKGGKELYLNIKKATIKGAMSNLGFEETGEPKRASFDIMNLRKSYSVKLAEWDTNNKLKQKNWTKAVWMSGKTKVPFDIPNFLKNKTINVVAVLAPPFVMKKKSSKGSSDNETEEYEGLSIDILEHMKTELGFRYKISLAPDGLFGSRNRLTGKWNGVIREIIDEKAMLSIAPLTINSDGQNVVDFTHPYMTFGIAFIMRVNKVEENYFRFLKPYHRNLWIGICGMVLTMGVILWNFSTLSPFGYYGRYSQHPNKLKVKAKIKAAKNTLSFVNAIWSSWLCYLSQGGQHPASLSGKIAVSVFWFAILIMNATYTANLAAYLTVSRMQTPIETVEDLAHQTKIKYGTLMNSQLQKFFMDTDVPRFLVMGQFMEQRKTWMPTIQDAIDQVMNSNFAFIADRPILEFIARKKEYCGKLKVIGGGEQKSKVTCKKRGKRRVCKKTKLTFGATYGYGFALPLQSPTTNLFNMEIFRLQRDLIIDSLKHKWSSKETCEMIDNMKSQNGKGASAFIQRVSLNDMFGVFIFMGIGIGLGWIFMIMEWIYACIRDVATKQGPKGYCEAFGLRLQRVCADIFAKKEREEPEEEPSVPEVILPPKMPKQWVTVRKKGHLKPKNEKPNGSTLDVQSYEASV